MIDVIIPAYNAHDTIIKTLSSIALQNIKDKFNVYIVDDCSIVGYDKEVKLFKDKLNIKLLKMKKNNGPGLSRQFAIDNSDGKYIIFIDADDLFVDCYSVENLYKSIISDNYDMAVGIMIDETLDGYYEWSNHQGNLHGKMYKREFLKKHNIRFNSSKSSEDNGFNKVVLLSNPNIVYSNSYAYLYRNNKNSITQNDSLNYSFYSTEWFIYNMVWAASQAEEKNLNEKDIAIHIEHSYIYVYYTYLNNFYRDDANLILKWSKSIHEYYLKYNRLLTEQEKYDLYSEYQYFDIPKISFNEFLNRVELYNFKH